MCPPDRARTGQLMSRLSRSVPRAVAVARALCPTHRSPCSSASVRDSSSAARAAHSRIQGSLGAVADAHHACKQGGQLDPTSGWSAIIATSYRWASSWSTMPMPRSPPPRPSSGSASRPATPPTTTSSTNSNETFGRSPPRHGLTWRLTIPPPRCPSPSGPGPLGRTESCKSCIRVLATIHPWRAGELQDGVAALKDGHVGLVVLVNKYDGIDLPKEACELLILDGVPPPMDATERREAAVLPGSSTVLARQLQRIEQGMGRGVRDSEDHCAVLLLGAHLSIALHDPKQIELFSPATRAQIALSRYLW